MPGRETTEASRRFEIGAVLGTGAGRFLIPKGSGLHLAYVMLAIFFWLAYVRLRYRQDPAVLVRWGLGTKRLARAVAAFAPVALAALAACVLFGFFTGKAEWNARLLGLLLLYPFWGLVQQFLVVVLLAGNLRETSWGGKHPAAVLGLTVALFTVAHLPTAGLAALGLTLGTYCTVTYFRTGSLLPLGLFHGWFATLAYVFVLGQDPWADVVSSALTGAAP